MSKRKSLPPARPEYSGVVIGPSASAECIGDFMGANFESNYNLVMAQNVARVLESPTTESDRKLNEAALESIRRRLKGNVAQPTVGPDESSNPWMPAGKLWPNKFDTIRQVRAFRKKHPEMFKNPSHFKLSIHSVLWLRYWADHEKGGFDSLDADVNSPITEYEPDIQQTIEDEAASRYRALRAKKQAGKQ